MTEKGFIVYFQGNDEPEYLFDERNEIRHFDSEEEVNRYLEEWGLSDSEDILVKYHVFCRRCAKEFFFETDEVPEDTDFYLCPACMKNYE